MRSRDIVRTWSPLESTERVADDTYWMEFPAPDMAERAVPGQFAMVGFGLSGYATPFLPRPNSIAAVRDGRIGFLIRVYGHGSRRLARMRPGDRALLLGPLGTSYELGDAKRILCIAGGVGLAPFIFLLDRYRNDDRRRIQLLYGERRGAAVFDLDRLSELTGAMPEVFTEDGELGRRGTVMEGADLTDVDLVLTCGPTAMLRTVRDLAREADVPCQVAVEEHMACGMGTCIGCVVQTVDPETGELGYQRACIEGPVFPAERLRWST